MAVITESQLGNTLVADYLRQRFPDVKAFTVNGGFHRTHGVLLKDECRIDFNSDLVSLKGPNPLSALESLIETLLKKHDRTCEKNAFLWEWP